MSQRVKTDMMSAWVRGDGGHPEGLRSRRGPRSRRGGWIVGQRQSGRRGQHRGVRDEYRGARSGAPRRGGERGSGRGVGGGRGSVGRKQKGSSAVVWSLARAPMPRQLFETRSWHDVRCRARQVQVRGFSGSPGSMVDPQSHRRAGAFAGRPMQRRAEEVKSELDRVTGMEVGMVSNQMEAGRHAQE
jgi:hypothetical protein